MKTKIKTKIKKHRLESYKLLKEGSLMIRIFKTTDSGIRKVAVAEEGCWIALTNPTSEELTTIADQFNIDVDDLKSPLDEEERFPYTGGGELYINYPGYSDDRRA